MYAVILSGGSGTRLWPLSREEFPKQYLLLDDCERTLFQETVARVRPVIKDRNIIIVTHAPQEGEICRQLTALNLNPKKVTVLCEPRACNTAPAIGLAAWYLTSTRGTETIMAVLPSDHLIPSRKEFTALLTAGEQAARRYGLVTFGIVPAYPETGYGYICKGDPLDENVFQVKKFVEKPDRVRAEEYLKDPCFLWNSGMFVFRVEALISAYRRHLPEMAGLLDRIDWAKEPELDKIYENLESISIDYGIMEKTAGVAVIPANIGWSDMGSFEAYYQVMPRDDRGNYCRGRILARDTRNSLILSGSRLVGAVGLDNLIVVDSDDALLVCSREQAQQVRELTAELEENRTPEYIRHPTVNRPWGSFTTLAKGEIYQVKKIRVLPKKRLSLQSHRFRSEHWVVVAGEALVTVGEQKKRLETGEAAFISCAAKHRLENTGDKELEVIEIQNGDYLGEDDIIRYEDDFGRVPGGEIPPEEQYRRWLACPGLDPVTRSQLEKMADDPDQICSCFGCELEFGTGGMRGVIGPGTNRINRYIVRRATQGLADYLQKDVFAGRAKKVAIAYDTRRNSHEFAVEASLVLAANGIKVFLFDNPRPTPELSFAVRRLGCAAGIVITASHNPSIYNGYKVYGPDGGQAVPPMIDRLMESIASVDLFDDVQSTGFEEAQSAGRLELIGQDLDQAYLEAVKSLSLSNPRQRLKVIYTPLHGSGASLIPGLLRAAGYIDLSVVQEQMSPDPEFATVKVPNPEDPAAFKLALELARRRGADLVLGTDPDGDRLGCAARNFSGDYGHLTGNQIGALLIDYILSRLYERGELPSNGVLIRTIVTGNLGDKIAAEYGVKTIETLTGFKYIGDKIREFEETGEYRFLFGYEESNGFLAGTFGRDKDAVGASFLIAEMAAYHQERGRNLFQVLDDLYRKYGYFYDDLVSIELKEMGRAEKLMEAFQQIPAEMAGEKVIQKRDYCARKSWDLLTGREYPLELPCARVLYYLLESGAWFCIRPSGTEPKVKIYFSVGAGTAEQAEAKLELLKQEVLSRQPGYPK